MQHFKTYKHVHRHDTDVSFRITRTEDFWAERGGTTDEPHRHDFYTVLLTRKAKGLHYIDFNAYPLAPNQVFFVSPAQVHQVVEHEQSFGFVLLFSTEFLAANNIPAGFIDDLSLFNDHGHTPPLPLTPSEMDKLLSYCEEMYRLYTQPIQFNELAIGSYLQLFLISCNNLCSLSIDNTQNREAGNTILKNFKDLVNEKHASWHATSEYAEALHVTPDHLNRVVKSLAGKSAKEFIQARITVAAKRMLYFTNMSAKEIGYQLGFSEPANFSAFFKKETGISPSEFKKKT